AARLSSSMLSTDGSDRAAAAGASGAAEPGRAARQLVRVGSQRGEGSRRARAAVGRVRAGAGTGQRRAEASQVGEARKAVRGDGPGGGHRHPGKPGKTGSQEVVTGAHRWVQCRWWVGALA